MTCSKISLDALSLFSGSMAQCLSSGLSPRKALELSGRTVCSESFRRCIHAAIRACDQGAPISEGLQSGGRQFPHFFLPVIRAGELGGRQVEAFELVQDHCRRVKPSVTLVRNTWLYPLICVLFGWFVRTGIFLYFGLYHFAWLLVRDTFVTGLVMVAAVWLVLRIRLVKEAADRLLLQIPVIRETEIRLAVVLFFGTFRLMYAAGGLGVLPMFDLALSTVRNSAVRRDFSKARRILERQGTVGDAFEEPSLLEDQIKGLIATGSLGGQLDTSLTQVVGIATQQLEFRLKLLNQFLQRLVAFEVAVAIADTVLMCLLYPPGR